MNAEISETVGARLLRFDVQIPELLTQRKLNMGFIGTSIIYMKHFNSLAFKERF